MATVRAQCAPPIELPEPGNVTIDTGELVD
jgi:hypothetical protein